MRYLMAVLMVGLLAACNAGSTSPSFQPLPSIGGATESTAPSAESASAAASASSEPSESAAMAADCQSAWSEVDLSGVQGIGDLDALAGELNATFEQCNSVDDWVAAAQDVLPVLDASVLRGWADARCAADSSLEQTPICSELGS